MIASYGFAMGFRMHADGGDWNWLKMKVSGGKELASEGVVARGYSLR